MKGKFACGTPDYYMNTHYMLTPGMYSMNM